MLDKLHKKKKMIVGSYLRTLTIDTHNSKFEYK